MSREQSIAVIISTRNRAYCLQKALDSISQQTRLPDEVIIVNDGSSDNTPDLIQDWKRTTPFPVKLLDTPPQGVVKARNLAMRCCESDLVAMLDDDDFYTPEHLRLLAKPFQYDNNLTLTFCLSNTNQKQVQKFINRSPEKSSEDAPVIIIDNMFDILLPGSLFVPSEVMYRTAAANAINNFDTRYTHCSDWEFFLRLLQQGKAGFVDEVLTQRVRGADSMGKKKGGLVSIKYHIEICLDKVEERNPLQLSDAESHYLYEVIEEKTDGYRYRHSNLGLSEYMKVIPELIRYRSVGFALQPKALLRAMAYTVGLKKAPPPQD